MPDFQKVRQTVYGQQNATLVSGKVCPARKGQRKSVSPRATSLVYSPDQSRQLLILSHYGMMIQAKLPMLKTLLENIAKPFATVEPYSDTELQGTLYAELLGLINEVLDPVIQCLRAEITTTGTVSAQDYEFMMFNTLNQADYHKTSKLWMGALVTTYLIRNGLASQTSSDVRTGTQLSMINISLTGQTITKPSSDCSETHSPSSKKETF
ncbi:hypothetical protein EK21DRAFT_84593 [Setomelanomma holmii]|uniref:Uncharacterized protein n=1 Tax=Setomelanomma holmii TaxID=210430 RepID=A0A9P4HHY4_9PLEO|nr:hypothetical protein EK21DRAFT_84593 [Setomelanomma holmii]